MNTGAEALLDRLDAALNFANMAISQDNVHCNGADVLANTVKFVVSMDVAHVEASRTIQVEGSVDFNKHGFVCAVRYRADGAETDATGNGVEESKTLNKKKSAQSMTLRWCVVIGAGRGTASNVGARGAAELRVTLPLRTATSGP